MAFPRDASDRRANTASAAFFESTIVDILAALGTIRKQVPFRENTNMWKSIFEATNENNDLQDNAIHRDARTASEINVEHGEQTQLLGKQNVKKKKGRPRKEKDDSTDRSSLNKKDDDTSREIPDTIVESATRDKRRASKIRITANMSDLSDESESEKETEDKIFVKKRGRPPGSVGRGRIRGRGRGRGRGRATSQNSLDGEYIPRLTTKDVSQLDTKESDKINDAATNSNAPNVGKTVSCSIF